MSIKSIGRRIGLAVLAASILAGAGSHDEAEDSRWVHPLCQPLSVGGIGPFVELADGSLMTIDAEGMRVSKDDGLTWSDSQVVCEGVAGLRDGHEPASFYESTRTVEIIGKR
jgi:hypothetical protein